MIQKNLSFNKVFFLFLMITLAETTVSNNSYAVDPEEFLKDPKQELRARNISKNVRCLVCQNQSIDESSAPLAKDLRMIVRNKITEGLTDKEVYKFLTDRYGDFILLNPPFKTSTMILWALPFALFFIAAFVLYWHNKNSNSR